MMTAAIRILYVDDEPDLLDIGKMFLEQSGEFTVTTALSAQEGIRLLEQEKFDAIVSDYQMPGMDGIHFLVEVRSRFGPIPFILFTGRGREEVVIQAINSGVDFYLQKGGEPGAQFAELTHKIKSAASSKRADDTLRKSEEQYRTILQTTMDGFWIIDISNGGITEVNETYCRMTGYSRAEILNLKIPDLDASLNLDEQAAQIKNIIAKGSGIFETRHRRKDGSVFDVELSVTYRNTDGGKLICFCRDITERKKVDNEIMFKNAILSTQQETSLNAILIVDENGNILNYNHKFIETWGISDELLAYGVDEPLLQFVVGQLVDPEAFLSRVRYLYENKAEKSFEEILLKDGRILERFSAPMLSEQGKYYGRVWYFRDITDRKRAEEALQFTRHSVDSATETLVTIAKDGHFADVNDAFCRKSGYSKEELLTMTVHDIDPDYNAEIWSAFWNKLKQSGSLTIETTHRTKEGKTYPVETTLTYFEYNGCEYHCGFARDITERKRAEDEQRKSEEKFRSLAESSPDYIMRYDRECRHTYMNPAALRAAGLTEEQIIGKTHRESGFDEAQSRFYEERITGVFETGKPYQTQFDWDSVDGRVVLDWLLTPEFSDDGTVRSVLGVSRDITRLKNAEEAMRQNEALLKRTGEIARVGGWEMDAETLAVTWTEETYHIHEVPLGQMPLLEGAIHFFHPDDQAKLSDAITHALATGEGYDMELRFITATGKHLWTRTVCQPQIVDGKTIRLNGTFQDITDRKQAEEELLKKNEELNASYEQIAAGEEELRANLDELTRQEDALRESKRELTDIIEFLPDATFVIDLKGIVIAWNRAMEVMTGIKKEAMIGKGDYEYTIPFYGERRKQLLDLIDLDDEEIKSKYHYVQRKGQTLYAEVFCPALYGGKGAYVWATGSPLFDIRRNRIGAIESIRDITERKRAEEAMHESEARYRTLVEHIPQKIFMKDRNSRYISINENFANDLGIHPDGIVGKSDADLFPAKLAAKYRADDVRIMETGKTEEFEERYLNEGKETWVHTIKTLVKDKNGEISGVCGVFWDITERKRVQEELLRKSEELASTVEELKSQFDALAENERAIHESEAQKIAILNGITTNIAFVDKDLKILWANKIAAESVNKSPAEMTGHTCYSFWGDPARPCENCPTLKVFETKQSAHIIQHTPDGRIWDEKGEPVFDENGNLIGVVEIAEDITGRKKTEEALIQANKKLTLLSSITRHDINNQLTGLRGYLAILEKKQTDPTHSEYFQKVAFAAQRISAMIQFTKGYECVGVKAPVWHDCHTLADTAAKQAPPGKIIVKNDLPAGTEIFADPLVVKVFYNLMDNAARYGKKITTIRFSVEERDGDQIIVCEDDGDGVVAEEKEKIFDRGFGKNTGLGLALSREILDITGITIRETGEPGKGARFEMAVPKEAWRMKGNGE